MTTVLPIGTYHPAELQRVAWRREMPAAAAPLDIKPVQEMPGIDVAKESQSVAPAQSAFGEMLSNFVGEVNARQAAAGEAVQGLLSGDKTSLHQTMIAMEEASVSFQLMVEVRNKLMESYQELMRMQI